MENILTLVNALTWFAAALGGALSAVFVVYSGYLFMSAEGDAQRMAQARKSLLGVLIGVVLIGGAFIFPATISRYVIEPADGVRVDPRSGVDCDGLLRDQLVIQRTAQTPDRMQFLVARIQGQRTECSPDFWSPVVKKGSGYPNGCITGANVGDVPLPEGLKSAGAPSTKSSRDGDNNIIVYWVHPDTTTEPVTGLPSDGSVCWLYVASFNAWTEAYRP